MLIVDQGGGKSGCNVIEDISPTLATTHGGEPVILENHPADSRVKISQGGGSADIIEPNGYGRR